MAYPENGYEKRNQDHLKLHVLIHIIHPVIVITVDKDQIKIKPNAKSNVRKTRI